jgi:hypothetical protein
MSARNSTGEEKYRIIHPSGNEIIPVPKSMYATKRVIKADRTVDDVNFLLVEFLVGTTYKATAHT